MENTDHALMNLLRSVLLDEKPADPALTPEEWQALLRSAEAHKLLPLILDAACALPSCRHALSRHSERTEESASPVQSLPLGGKVSPQATDEVLSRQAAPSTDQTVPVTPPHPSSGLRETPDATFPSRGRQTEAPVSGHSERSEESASPSRSAGNLPANSPDWKVLVLEQVTRQAIQENEFLNLILDLRARGLEPVVMKGCVCRALYPKPLLRPSVDDDLLIPDELAPAFHAALLELGMTADEPDADVEKAWELSYHKPNSPLYIELHKRLFDPESDVFIDFNEPFAGAVDRAVPVQIQDVTLKTLAPTDHLLFLILHAYKHFLFSGFGLRIVADVCLYARQYGPETDFEKIAGICDARRCGSFTAALFRIGEKYLGLPIPTAFDRPEVDETALLEDVLAAGLVGADIDRLHSANITLGAVADHNTGRTPGSGWRKELLPSAKQLSGRYPWLEKRPWLLPAAWAARIGTYLKTRGKYGRQSPAASLRIGKERVQLLRTYGIIDE